MGHENELERRSVPLRPRILVVEDEEPVAEGIVLHLEREGYDAEVEGTGPGALARWRRGGVDLILLDVRLPGMSGFSVCEALRGEGGRTPVIFLVARGRAEDRNRGFEVGGDDFITKPLHVPELLVRVEAILRRQEWERPDLLERETIRFGRCAVSFVTGECLERSGARTRLTDKEAAILRRLMEEPGKPVRREELVSWIRPPGEEPPTARTIDNFVLRLRKRFEEDPRRPQFIQTVFGIGYRFVP
jgi:two-component system alkaline phosphatase synthesis response regulator PhoP